MFDWHHLGKTLWVFWLYRRDYDVQSASPLNPSQRQIYKDLNINKNNPSDRSCFVQKLVFVSRWKYSTHGKVKHYKDDPELRQMTQFERLTPESQRNMNLLLNVEGRKNGRVKQLSGINIELKWSNVTTAQHSNTWLLQNVF